MPSPREIRFHIYCCGKRRGMLPGGVLVCGRCDFDHDAATVIPNERYVKDIPGIGRMWEVPRAQEG